MAGAGGVVSIPFYATGFRGDQLEAALVELAKRTTRYGGHDAQVLRFRDDRYKFAFTVHFDDYTSWERFWEGDDGIDFRVNCQGWFQVPVLYSWADLVSAGEKELAPG